MIIKLIFSKSIFIHREPNSNIFVAENEIYLVFCFGKIQGTDFFFGRPVAIYLLAFMTGFVKQKGFTFLSKVWAVTVMLGNHGDPVDWHWLSSRITSHLYFMHWAVFYFCIGFCRIFTDFYIKLLCTRRNVEFLAFWSRARKQIQSW